MRRLLNRKPNGSRSPDGLTTIVLVLVLAFFVVGVFGVFSFEATRVNTAKQELQHVCEAAALATAAAMPDPFKFMDPNGWDGDISATEHTTAATAGQQVFISNSVLGVWLTNTIFSDERTSNAEHAFQANPDANNACMYIEFHQPDGSIDQWDGYPLNSASVRMIGSFAEVPSFGVYCGIGKVVVHGDATAPIPWIETFHSDWAWAFAGAGPNLDPTDHDEWQMGTLWSAANPRPYVQNGNLYIPENPGGFMSTGGPTGTAGFRQRYGYFQAVAKFNSHSWSKFWLTNWQNTAPMPQLDVVDSYGGDNAKYHGIVHSNATPNGAGDTVNSPNDIATGIDLTADFHTYGMMWLPNNPNIYFLLDGKIVKKVPKAATTDLNQMQLIIGNGHDTVFNTSTGAEPPAIYKWVSGWELTPYVNSTNVTNRP